MQTFGDTTHTLIERNGYNGLFLPGYKQPISSDPLLATPAPIGLLSIDHVDGNQPDLQMDVAARWYETNLLFHRLWSAEISTDYSAFIMTVKMPMNEPAPGKNILIIMGVLVFSILLSGRYR